MGGLEYQRLAKHDGIARGLNFLIAGVTLTALAGLFHARFIHGVQDNGPLKIGKNFVPAAVDVAAAEAAAVTAAGNAHQQQDGEQRQEGGQQMK